MTTANKVTITRILLVPVFISALLFYWRSGYEYYRYAAIVFFLVASVSDGVDGYIARHYNQRSELGAILDPLADKLLLVSGAILLSIGVGGLSTIPIIFIISILTRDMLILLGVLVISYVCGSVKVRPRWPGKTATVLQMITVLWVLFRFPEKQIDLWAYVATFFTVLSAVYYVTEGIRQLNTSPASAPVLPKVADGDGVKKNNSC